MKIWTQYYNDCNRCFALGFTANSAAIPCKHEHFLSRCCTVAALLPLFKTYWMQSRNHVATPTPKFCVLDPTYTVDAYGLHTATWQPWLEGSFFKKIIVGFIF